MIVPFPGKRFAGDHLRYHQTGAVLVGKGSKWLVGHPGHRREEYVPACHNWTDNNAHSLGTQPDCIIDKQHKQTCAALQHQFWARVA
jgi:hypothetical protein